MNFSRPIHVRGVTLIIVVGVLAILAALGAGFYSLMMSKTRTAVKNSDFVRAELMAKAGIEDAIARLRQQLGERSESANDAWCTYDWQNGGKKRISYAATDAVTGQPLEYTRALGSTVGANSDHYILEITDPASRIDINSGNNLPLVLNNLCRVIGEPLVPADGDAIAAHRERHGKYIFVEDIKPVLTISSGNLGNPEKESAERDKKFAALCEYLTVDTPITSGEACVNINTASDKVLTAVLAKKPGELARAANLAQEIIKERQSPAGPLSGADMLLRLKDYGVMVFTDSSRRVFTIRSTGRVAKRSETLAQIKIEAVVKLYDDNWKMVMKVNPPRYLSYRELDE